MKSLLSSAVFCAALSLASAASPSYDVVVYGGTSGGVIAALQAAKMGRTAVLIEPTQFLGGLTTGGLGATDIGNKRAIGGLSREFYGRIWQHYQQPSAWTRQSRDEYTNRRGSANDPNEKTMWTFEPHVATRIYDDMLRDAGAKVTVVGQAEDLRLYLLPPNAAEAGWSHFQIPVTAVCRHACSCRTVIAPRK